MHTQVAVFLLSVTASFLAMALVIFEENKKLFTNTFNVKTTNFLSQKIDAYSTAESIEIIKTSNRKNYFGLDHTLINTTGIKETFTVYIQKYLSFATRYIHERQK